MIEEMTQGGTTGMENQDSIQVYYRMPGPATDPGARRPLLEGLPTTVPELVAGLQQLMIHIFWARRYGVELTPDREAEVQIRTAHQKLGRIGELDPRPLTEGRDPAQRLVGNCRDFSVMMVTLLKAQGVPARARCGFGTYFTPGKYEDHWVIEYWNAAAQRWVMVDAQLDALQQQVLQLDFNPFDMPPGKFVLAGQAWQMARRGEVDPELFGIFEWHGMDFIRGNVLRDLLALNRVEVLPWDFWGWLTEQPVAESSPEALGRIDRAAALTLGGDDCFEDLQDFYQQHPEIHAPAGWFD
ncbi:MAG TPA: transglutaminase-like domain-containing protein [Anaerolineaceae bacterium]|nr:transglutaminase-like domain-containing protein [Anaerolineaceae bacterium]